MRTLVSAMMVAVVGVVLVGSSARAADVGPYQVEAELRYEAESEEDADVTIIGVGGTYAFKSVDPGTGPLNESLFLARVPSAGAMVGFASGDVDMGGPTRADLSGTQFAVTGGYADKNVPVGVDLMYMSRSADVDMAVGSATMDMTGLELKAGYFAMPSLIVGLSYELQTMEVDGMEMDTTGIGLVGKWVENLGGGTAVNVEFGYISLTAKMKIGPLSDEQKASQIELGGDYYFTQLMGAGVAVELFAGDEADDDSTTIDIHFKWNLSTSLGVTVSYKMTTYEASGVDDTTALGVSVIGRF